MASTELENVNIETSLLNGIVDKEDRLVDEVDAGENNMGHLCQNKATADHHNGDTKIDEKTINSVNSHSEDVNNGKLDIDDSSIEKNRDVCSIEDISQDVNDKLTERTGLLDKSYDNELATAAADDSNEIGSKDHLSSLNIKDDCNKPLNIITCKESAIKKSVSTTSSINQTIPKSIRATTAAADKRPKRESQRRSVFEMLKSDDDDEDDVCEEEEEDEVRKKRKLNEEDDDNDDEIIDEFDFHFKKNAANVSEKKTKLSIVNNNVSDKKNCNKKSIDDGILKLFDDDDLPLTGKKTNRGRKKKKKDDDDDGDEGWHRMSKITGKIFDDDDDDHYYDDDDDMHYAHSKTLLHPSKSNKPAIEKVWSSDKKSSNKKFKVDIQGLKFMKSRDSTDVKKAKSGIGSKVMQHQNQYHHQQQQQLMMSKMSPQSSTYSSTLVTSTTTLEDDELERKASILKAWENKLKCLDAELEERVNVIRKNEGKMVREERRLKEFENSLRYREKILSFNCLDINNGDAIKKASDKLPTLSLTEFSKIKKEMVDMMVNYKEWIEQQYKMMRLKVNLQPLPHEKQPDDEEGDDGKSLMPLKRDLNDEKSGEDNHKNNVDVNKGNPDDKVDNEKTKNDDNIGNGDNEKAVSNISSNVCDDDDDAKDDMNVSNDNNNDDDGFKMIE